MTSLRQIYYSFPVRLLVLHFRNHLVLIALWGVLALLATGSVGRFFGMHYLLLTPDYQGKVGFWSFFITGAALGAFIMIWNLTTYLLCADRFSFLATLEAPFTKYSLNNSLIPLTFLAVYVSSTTYFQWHNEFTASKDILINVSGLVLGVATLISVLAIYLHLTNKDIASFLKPGKFIPRPGARLLAPGYRLPTLWEIRAGATRWRVDTYLTERLHPRLVRSVAHYNPEMLGRVFRQNHFNAVAVQITALVFLMFLGLFMDRDWARIPTGASLFLLCSMVLSMFGAVTFWFRNWSTLVFLLILFVVNYITGWGFFNYRNRAYGLDYSHEMRAEYSNAAFEKICSPQNIASDIASTRQILDKWLEKNRTADGSKPKLVFVCVSGGGLRSAVWTMQTLQRADQATGGKLMRRTALVSGASGGILGAGYLRDVYWQQQQGRPFSFHDTAHIERMSRDLLNPVTFAIVANDLFFPLTTFRSGNFTYRKDRGYLFERQMIENTNGLLARRLADYRQPEAEALIPMMVISPFVLNDARRLLISPQGVSYLMHPPDDARNSLHPEIDAVDFRRLLEQQQADSLSFTSALRMNCTYPLILPNVWLPTRPAVEAMDAGFRDNYGVSTAARFIHVFRDWIQENTAGVVIVQIRCWEKVDIITESDRKGIVSNILTPVGLATHLTAIQDYEQDNSLALLDDLLGKNRLAVIRFIYRPVRKEHEASMSLHITKREKNDLMEAFYLPENQASLAALKQVLGVGY
ncbi:MAG: patatin-like phospholipase family protein [Saprospiraceae bacterium]|nr:patatin-like phospholipase family protein [Saprospiraceae bacterium]